VSPRQFSERRGRDVGRGGNAIHAFWHFGPPDNPQAVSGMDLVILDGDKAANLYAFVDDPSSGVQPPT
jgi:hypothetical protein